MCVGACGEISLKASTFQQINVEKVKTCYNNYEHVYKGSKVMIKKLQLTN